MRRLILLLYLSFALACVTEAQKPPAEVFRVGSGISAPQVTHRVEPKYSDEAFKAKLEGSVELYIEVQPDGSVGNIQVSRSLGKGLDERAVEAVQQWKFNPAMKDRKPVAVGVLITVHFRLRPSWRPLGGPPVLSENNSLGGTTRKASLLMAVPDNQDPGQSTSSQDAVPQRIEFVGALEMLTESAVAVRLSDGRIIEAALTADSDAAQLASIKNRYIGDIAQIRCKPIPRSYNAAEDRPQFLALTGIRFLRGPKQDELAAALKSRHRRNPRNLLRLPDTGETDLGLSLSSLRLPQKPPESRNSHAPGGIGDNLAFIERSRLRIISYLANVPNYIADEMADRYQAPSIPPAWTKVDSIRCEVRFNGNHESRQNIFLNNKAWLEPFVMLPGFTWGGGFGEKLKALFDPINPVKFFFYQRILYKGQHARVYRFNAPKDGIGSWQSGCQIFHPAFEGKVTITEDDGMAVRLESKAIDFPPDFPVSSTEEIIVWGWVDAGNKPELLPVKHDLLVVHAAQHQAYLDRIEYKDHRHFEALSSVAFED